MRKPKGQHGGGSGGGHSQAAEGKSKTGGGGGIIFDTTRGQHILINPLVIHAIVEKASIRPSDTVLEIGPGTGNLTVKLLAVAKKVIAFEVDPRMVAELQKRVQGKPYAHKLQVIKGDAIKSEFPFFNVCVANVPYAISSPLVFKLLNHRPFFRCAVLMFQREFAMRMVAKPPSPMWCRLSVNCQLLARVNHLIKVSAKSFKPPPKVESSVIRIEQRNPPPPVNFQEWDELIKVAFSRKHKKMHAMFTHKSTLQRLLQLHQSYCRIEDKPALSLEQFKRKMETVLAAELPNSNSNSTTTTTTTDISSTSSTRRTLGMARAAEMKIDDFVFMLAKFVEAGIRFH